VFTFSLSQFNKLQHSTCSLSKIQGTQIAVFHYRQIISSPCCKIARAPARRTKLIGPVVHLRVKMEFPSRGQIHESGNFVPRSFIGIRILALRVYPDER